MSTQADVTEAVLDTLRVIIRAEIRLYRALTNGTTGDDSIRYTAKAEAAETFLRTIDHVWAATTTEEE
jgi:hypothetical protein